ncbi:MAG TPA: RIO1 family regulatory kinase/ATPase [Candidatus Methanofastidiosa archaeon]|nr:RIO1 family regulatory kinase/ATPase [Candidatus Methanofastidiosa archaeon]HPR41141.1 RIO1 family regulatory kinase/ATPase [Candidatus Methanofastidiosa archaeon]
MPKNKVQDFFSRKNVASLVDIDGELYVSKKYVIGDATIEWDMLKKCFERGVRVPRPIKIDDGTILMEYVDGSPLSDRKCLSSDQCRGIAEWLHEFHAALPGMKRGDAMLRNFLEHEEKIYGIDFEEAGAGDQLEDVSMLCASILTESPIFEASKIMCARKIVGIYSMLSGTDVHDRCVDLIGRDLFAIYRRWRDHRGRKDKNLLQWTAFYKTVL